MLNAVDTLTTMIDDPKRFEYSSKDLHELQVAAIDERLQECANKIKYLEILVDRTGVSSVSTLGDIVPLLFSNSFYKNYAGNFIRDGKWDIMTTWVRYMSKYPTNDINLDNIKDIDEWIQRMFEIGHCLTTTSGTSTVPAILSSSLKDLEWLNKDCIQTDIWAAGVYPEQNRYQIQATPTYTSPKNVAIRDARITALCNPADPVWHFPSSPISVAGLLKTTTLRSKIRHGNATDDEIEQFEKMNSDRQAELDRAYILTAEHMIERRHDLLDIAGMWTGLYAIAKIVRDRGYGAKDFNPDNTIYAGGGLKGTSLPDDYQEFVSETFNISSEKYYTVYSMQELNSKMPSCKHGHYHIPPWVVPMIVEVDASKLIDYDPTSGTYSGRAAFFDLSIDGRWGGVVTGDQVTINFNRCSCGNNSPTIISINRDLGYSDIDKFNCSSFSILGAVEQALQL